VVSTALNPRLLLYIKIPRLFSRTSGVLSASYRTASVPSRPGAEPARAVTTGCMISAYSRITRFSPRILRNTEFRIHVC